MHHGKPTANDYAVAMTIQSTNAQPIPNRTSKIDSSMERTMTEAAMTQAAIE
jgi:hypothetical protein